ncbi:MAG: TSUP family transporter, partial [Thermodesulfobacteriota bacterium]
MIKPVLYVCLGLVAGVFSGLIGIGGGVIIVPALVFLFGFSQH